MAASSKRSEREIQGGLYSRNVAIGFGSDQLNMKGQVIEREKSKLLSPGNWTVDGMPILEMTE